MEKGLLLTKTSRKREKYIIGTSSIIILIIIGIYLFNLDNANLFSMYICPFIVALVTSLGINIILD